MSKLAKALTAAAGNAGGTLGYVEDVFSTYLYTGTGGDGNTAQTITNGIDLSGEGGLVWIQERDDGANSYSYVADSERGSTKYLTTQVTNTEGTQADAITSFNSDGFTLGVDSIGRVNYATGSPLTGRKYASWTFRKAEKFFDVVTYTGTGSAQNIAHNLGVAPAVVIVKSTSNAQNWYVYHESLGNTQRLLLDSTVAAATSSSYWNNTSPTDSVFTVGTQANVNTSGATYVAYLFASDAGGFGDDGSESIIKCGSYTTDANEEATIDLGFEPQWILFKRTDSSLGGDWNLFDTMRGITADTSVAGAYVLEPNTSDAEDLTQRIAVTSTGFKVDNYGANRNYIYIAIRRPMKTPESGTEVFAIDTAGSVDSNKPQYRSGFPVDMVFERPNVSGSENMQSGSRLTQGNFLRTNLTNAEAAFPLYQFDYMNGYYNSSTTIPSYYAWMFKRATGFFDVVAYTTPTQTNTTVYHNLGATPELAIIKRRNNTGNWFVAIPNDGTLILNSNTTKSTTLRFTGANETQFTAETGGTYSIAETSADWMVYLFATLAGVSKVGSYIGTGSNVDVDCGFSAGARFILIKRTDSTGDWYVWDSARGIVAGNDPYLLLNSTAAEVTSTDYIDPLSSGFTVTSSAPAALNASGGTYIFLAIA